MRIVSVDPGLRCFGFALFEDRRLVTCGLGREPFAWRFPKADVSVVEIPQVYPRARSKGDPNDLVALAVQAGVLGLLCGNSQIHVKPRRWKGTIPKTKTLDRYLVHRRNLAALSPAEAGTYRDALEAVPPGLRHNVADAVGLGLWFTREGCGSAPE